MQKNELISLTNKMCKELLAIIDEQKESTKEEVANYLVESAQIIMDLDEDKINSSGFTELLFSNAYKDLAKKSISSYADTNATIEKLTQMHEKALLECNDQHIDLESITDRFEEIQTHMSNEVSKANEVITQLTSQVKTLEETSNLDALTKVYNRRALSTFLNELCSKDKAPENLHMLILDIDDFKKINDSFGHVAGDKVLIFISHILKKTLRDGDKVFRYGGEEFIIILNRLDDEQCKIITTRLLNLIRNNKLIYQGNTLRVTISIGATRFAQGDNPDSLISRADKALYIAKDKGKNQIYVVNE